MYVPGCLRLTGPLSHSPFPSPDVLGAMSRDSILSIRSGGYTILSRSLAKLAEISQGAFSVSRASCANRAPEAQRQQRT